MLCKTRIDWGKTPLLNLGQAITYGTRCAQASGVSRGCRVVRHEGVINKSHRPCMLAHFRVQSIQAAVNWGAVSMRMVFFFRGYSLDKSLNSTPFDEKCQN